MHWIFKWIAPYRRKMAVGLTIKIAGTLMDLILPYILAHLIDRVVPMGNVTHIYLWGALMLLCSFFGFFGNVIGNRMASAVARDSTRKVRHDLFAKIGQLSCRQMDEITIPSLESRLTSDTYNVHQVIGSMQRLGVRAPILLLGGLVVTFLTEPVLTLVICAVIPFIAVTVTLVTVKSIPMFERVQKASDEMVRAVRENSQGIRVIKALSRSEREKERFRLINRKLVSEETKAGLVTALSSPIVTFFLYLGQAGVIVLGAYRVVNGLTTPGKIIAFLSYFTMIHNAMLSIRRVVMILSKGAASATRIGEVLEQEEELLPIPESEAETKENGAFLEFDSVSFSYLGVKNNIENLSFRLEKGQSLGIIGATGSGKSTVVLLLERFYDVTQGHIYLNGKDIRTYGRKEFLEKFGSVYQNDTVFSETVSGNIDLWRGLDSEKLHFAAQVAQAEPFILEREKGYDSEILSGGANLSGGQRQRLLISRAVASLPEILIFDDSSSALDYKTDSDLRRAVRCAEELKNATKIYVSQRVSTILDCDLILVLDEGKVIGKGTHEELMETCPVYREISDSQMGGMILE